MIESGCMEMINHPDGLKKAREIVREKAFPKVRTFRIGKAAKEILERLTYSSPAKRTSIDPRNHWGNIFWCLKQVYLIEEVPGEYWPVQITDKGRKALEAGKKTFPIRLSHDDLWRPEIERLHWNKYYHAWCPDCEWSYYRVKCRFCHREIHTSNELLLSPKGSYCECGAMVLKVNRVGLIYKDTGGRI